MTKPSDFDAMSNQLWDSELKELQDLWAVYNYLYVEDPERADKLRKPRWGGFFRDLVQGWTVSEIILSISRLTDRPGSGKRENLTLEALLADPRLPGKLKCELEHQLRIIRESAEEIRKHRNKVVAHRDRPTALGEDTLLTLQVRPIADLIRRLQDVHRKHRRECMGSSVSEYGTHTHRGVKNLVKRLEQSERASLIFAHTNRSDEGKLRDWDVARQVFFQMRA